MFIIYDRDGIVQDIASKETALSRGKAFAEAVTVEIERTDIQVGDFFIDGKVVLNLELRKAQELKGVQYEVIRKTLEAEMARRLGYAEVERENQAELDALRARETQLK